MCSYACLCVISYMHFFFGVCFANDVPVCSVMLCCFVYVCAKLRKGAHVCDILVWLKAWVGLVQLEGSIFLGLPVLAKQPNILKMMCPTISIQV